MGAGGYQAIEDTCRKFTQRQLRALGCRRDGHGDYAPPSDSTFYRVLSKVDTHRFDRLVGDWLLAQELVAGDNYISALTTITLPHERKVL